ncbi:hypothetical protein K6119_02345 [Paracrocinitomix mangrovi]|uniref:hypothetical protein n=1 Tax=Paracrocinitomix mangrovi TaxID=2862509 RepID=UPI001C8EF296|nr:hypothetical protein [Paracrocinitomix mangrovi]UKN02360.1 hypothetical protein K6119_02345 [Paracrocinitomix mangrovi]
MKFVSFNLLPAFRHLLPLLIVFTLLNACLGEQADSQSAEKAEVFTITDNVFEGKVFALAQPTDNDSCSFKHNCDCCVFFYLFNDDNSFYDFSSCQGDETFIKGEWKVEDNALSLRYSPLYISKTYNWEAEFDATLPTYIYSDTTTEIKEYWLSPVECGNSFFMDYNDHTIEHNLYPSTYSFDSLQQEIKDGSLIPYMDSVETAQQLNFNSTVGNN